MRFPLLAVAAAVLGIEAAPEIQLHDLVYCKHVQFYAMLAPGLDCYPSSTYDCQDEKLLDKMNFLRDFTLEKHHFYYEDISIESAKYKVCAEWVKNNIERRTGIKKRPRPFYPASSSDCYMRSNLLRFYLNETKYSAVYESLPSPLRANRQQLCLAFLKRKENDPGWFRSLHSEDDEVPANWHSSLNEGHKRKSNKKGQSQATEPPLSLQYQDVILICLLSLGAEVLLGIVIYHCRKLYVYYRSQSRSAAASNGGFNEDAFREEQYQMAVQRITEYQRRRQQLLRGTNGEQQHEYNQSVSDESESPRLTYNASLPSFSVALDMPAPEKLVDVPESLPPTYEEAMDMLAKIETEERRLHRLKQWNALKKCCLGCLCCSRCRKPSSNPVQVV